jgi:hypothetical protein
MSRRRGLLFFFFSCGGIFLSLFSSFCIPPFLASEVFGCFEWLSIFVIPIIS